MFNICAIKDKIQGSKKFRKIIFENLNINKVILNFNLHKLFNHYEQVEQELDEKNKEFLKKFILENYTKRGFIIGLFPEKLMFKKDEGAKTHYINTSGQLFIIEDNEIHHKEKKEEIDFIFGVVKDHTRNEITIALISINKALSLISKIIGILKNRKLYSKSDLYEKILIFLKRKKEENLHYITLLYTFEYTLSPRITFYGNEVAVLLDVAHKLFSSSFLGLDGFLDFLNKNLGINKNEIYAIERDMQFFTDFVSFLKKEGLVKNKNNLENQFGVAVRNIMELAVIDIFSSWNFFEKHILDFLRGDNKRLNKEESFYIQFEGEYLIKDINNITKTKGLNASPALFSKKIIKVASYIIENILKRNKSMIREIMHQLSGNFKVWQSHYKYENSKNRNAFLTYEAYLLEDTGEIELYLFFTLLPLGRNVEDVFSKLEKSLSLLKLKKEEISFFISLLKHFDTLFLIDEGK